MSGLAEAFTSGWKAFVAEVTGSLLIMFIGTAVFSFDSGADEMKVEAARSVLSKLGTYTADAGLRFGMTLAALAIALGPVSGAHYNPVLSMAALINGRIEWQACLYYVLSQLLGYVAGGFIAWCFGGSAMTVPGTASNAVTKAIFMEVMITMVLALAFLGATDPERSDALKDLAGIAYGLALAVGHWIAADFRMSALRSNTSSRGAFCFYPVPFSGASMNPWRTFASALTESHWDDLWVYFVGPPVGAALSAVLYRYVLSGAKESSL